MKTLSTVLAMVFAFLVVMTILAMNRFKPTRIALYKLLKLPY